MAIELVIIGAGNPDVIKLIEDINVKKEQFKIIGFLEKNPKLIGSNLLGYPILDEEIFMSKQNDTSIAYVNNVMSSTKLHEAVTNKFIEQYGAVNFPNLIHPSVSLKWVELGKGNIIYQNVAIGAGVRLGNFNIVFYSSVIGHETLIGNNNLIAANTLISARCKLLNRIYISNSSTISIGTEICSDVFVGVGSVVINSIKKVKKVFGYPAKEMRF